MTLPQPARDALAHLLAWGEAHATFDKAVADVPAPQRGQRPDGLPYSLWELLEHVRLAQHDLLDFCLNPDYQQPRWPDDYWPARPAPPTPEAWDASVEAVRRDRDALAQIARDPARDLLAPIPHGSGQTLLRELLLAADHAAYHVGEMVAVRRLLGIWK